VLFSSEMDVLSDKLAESLSLLELLSDSFVESLELLDRDSDSEAELLRESLAEFVSLFSWSERLSLSDSLTEILVEMESDLLVLSD